ncbi:MAG: hypothetical protein Q8K71_10920 [Polaromonas sp.]|nr:hypothetical protein [Polaromonas sp.]MDP3753644.1 hypothetical protein [Polaromonas sp.]
MSEDVSIAAQALEVWGASVKPLPTSNKEECDWLAELEGCRLIVEEKLKFDDPASVAARNVALAQGQVHGSSQPLTSNNRISGIVRKAAGQLSSTASEVAHDLRILWFTGVGFDGEAKHYQLISTLYGSTRIFQLDHRHMRTCYFFRNSDFYRYRDHLDGAVAAHLNGNTATVKLCLNPYSPRWKALRDSPFAHNFKLGLIDPIAEEQAGEAYIVDSDIDRRDERAVIACLEKKYGLKHAMNMDMSMATASIRVPRANER